MKHMLLWTPIGLFHLSALDGLVDLVLEIAPGQDRLPETDPLPDLFGSP